MDVPEKRCSSLSNCRARAQVVRALRAGLGTGFRTTARTDLCRFRRSASDPSPGFDPPLKCQLQSPCGLTRTAAAFFAALWPSVPGKGVVICVNISGTALPCPYESMSSVFTISLWKGCRANASKLCFGSRRAKGVFVGANPGVHPLGRHRGLPLQLHREPLKTLCRI